jgi:hypothetical protein
MPAINAGRIAGQAPAHDPAAIAVVPVLSNKCAWCGTKDMQNKVLRILIKHCRDALKSYPG